MENQRYCRDGTFENGTTKVKCRGGAQAAKNSENPCHLCPVHDDNGPQVDVLVEAVPEARVVFDRRPRRQPCVLVHERVQPRALQLDGARPDLPNFLDDAHDAGLVFDNAHDPALYANPHPDVVDETATGLDAFIFGWFHPTFNGLDEAFVERRLALDDDAAHGPGRRVGRRDEDVEVQVADVDAVAVDAAALSASCSAPGQASQLAALR